MTPSRPGQFQIVMPDGLVIDRLPVGYANGRWRVRFVFSGEIAASALTSEMWDARLQALKQRITIDGIGTDLERVSGGGGGSDGEYSLHHTFRDNGVESLRIAYLHDGVTFAEEHVQL